MNYDSVTDVGRRIARKNGKNGGYGDISSTAGRPATLATRWLVSLALATRWLVSLALALAVAWTVAYAVPAFGGLFAVAAVGFAVVLAVPWLVVTGVVRALEAAE